MKLSSEKIDGRRRIDKCPIDSSIDLRNSHPMMIVVVLVTNDAMTDKCKTYVGNRYQFLMQNNQCCRLNIIKNLVIHQLSHLIASKKLRPQFLSLDFHFVYLLCWVGNTEYNP